MKDHMELVSEWLRDCNTSLKSDGQVVQSFIRASRCDQALIRNLIDLFYEDSEATKSFADLLAELYRTTDNEARMFTLEFIPALILAYVKSVYLQPAASHNSLSSCLLTLFNTTVSQSGNVDGEFRMPNLSRSSIYHDSETATAVQPTSTLPRALSSTSPIAALAAGLLSTVATGPIGIDTVQNTNTQQRAPTDQNCFVNAFGAATNPALRISAELRYPIITRLLVTYNRSISFMSVASLTATCRLCELVCALDCSQGGVNGNLSSTLGNLASSGVAPRRIPVDHFFVLQLVLAVCHALWNGMYNEADRALTVAEQRANHELYCDVLLLTNAVRSSQRTAVSSNAFELFAPPGGRQFASPSNGVPRARSTIGVSQQQRAKSESPNAALSGTSSVARQLVAPFGEEVDRPRSARSTTDVHIEVPLPRAPGGARPRDSVPAPPDTVDGDADEDGLSMRTLAADADDRDADGGQPNGSNGLGAPVRTVTHL